MQKLAVAARFKEQLVKTGHSDMCPWRDQAVPMALIQASSLKPGFTVRSCFVSFSMRDTEAVAKLASFQVAAVSKCSQSVRRG